MRYKSKLFFLLDVLLIVFFAFFTTYFANRAGHLALGGDGYAHATKIKFLVDFWPNIHWVYFWGNGIPVFLWYAPMPYVFLVVFFKIFSSAAMAINAVNLLSFVLIGIGIYGIVHEVTKNRIASLLAAFLTIPSPGLWYRIMVGTTPRTLGDGFLVLSLWFLIKALKEEKKGSLKCQTFLGLTLFTTLAFQSHIFTVLMMILFGFIIISVVANGFTKKIKFFFLTFLPASLLAFYFLLPFALTEHLSQASSSFGLFAVDSLHLRLLFYKSPWLGIIPGGGLLPLYVPALLILLPIVFLSGKLKGKPFTRRVVFAFLLLFLFFLVFGTATYFGYPATWYNVGFVPDEAFEFLSLTIPVTLGILFWLTIPKRLLGFSFVTLLLTIVSLVLWQYPLRYPLQIQVTQNYDAHSTYDQNVIWELLEGQENEKNYRYAHPATEISLWFNSDSEIPQNREFFPHGVMYPNWRSWQENALWNPKWDEKMEETKFLLDWFSIRWFSLLPPAFNFTQEKYRQDSDFEFKTQKLTSAEFGLEYKKATPILSSTNTPPILIIGEKADDRSYGPIIRILSTFNLSSQVVIPVRGKNFLDDYKKKELTRFPLIFLYEYRVKNPQKAGNLLIDYLTQGGKVIIESSSFISSGDRKAFEKALGFRSNSVEAKEGKWNFLRGQSDLTKGIDFTKFSPPLFETSAWKFFTVDDLNLNEGREPILSHNGQALIFRQKVGDGELVWSGLNLPYHALSYQNQEEEKFLVKILFGLLGANSEVLPRPKNLAQFINPQKRIVEILEPASGVLFKENYFANWGAFWEREGEKSELKVYAAGLDFMYVPLDQQQSIGKITLLYRRSFIERASAVASVAFLIVLLAFLLYYLKVGQARFKSLLDQSLDRSIGGLTRWWHKEDEE